jgi:hypothetical protein
MGALTVPARCRERTTCSYARMAEFVTPYSDLPLGTTDASVVALAERLKLSEVATLGPAAFRRCQSIYRVRPGGEAAPAS